MKVGTNFYRHKIMKHSQQVLTKQLISPNLDYASIEEVLLRCFNMFRDELIPSCGY